jgi:hypothetical protein
MGQPDRAILDFGQAIRIDPNLAVAYNGRGLAERAKGDSAGGDADIAKAKQLNPNVTPALADSKLSAENCLAATDELAKVAVIAQENNWTTTTLSTGGGRLFGDISRQERETGRIFQFDFRLRRLGFHVRHEVPATTR